MKYQLVLQWPESSIKDYDSLIEIEDVLYEGLNEIGEIDGHDAGCGEMNIFIHTNAPDSAFHKVTELLNSYSCWNDVKAAYRELYGDTYIVLWPSGLKDFKVK